MTSANRVPAPSGSSTLVLVAGAIAALHFGREILIPFALAFLISFLLAPHVERLERWIGRISAVILVVLALMGSFAGMGWMVSSQLFDLAGKLPEYKHNIQKKLWVLQPAQGGTLSKASEAIDQIQVEMDKDPSGLSPGGLLPRMPSSANAKDAFVIPVRVVETDRALANFLSGWLGPLLGPIGMAGLVMLYVVFMLIQREGLRDRLIRLIGVDRIGATTRGLDEAAARVSRYLLMLLIVNASYGICVAIGLYFIGVPNALLWGVMAIVLRFIPYLGPWLAAIMPVAVSFAVFDGWSVPIMTVSLYVVIELLSNNVMEPWLYGSNTGVSSLAIIIAAVFWAWLWGIVGLVLATPLTVCLVVLGQHVPRLEFLSVLLSDESALGPDALVYQRLLAMDQEEATETADLYLKQHSLVELYDEVLVPALVMAEQDFHRGSVDEAKQDYILQSLGEMIEELGDYAEDGEAAPIADPPPKPLLCLPAKDQADEIAGDMLVQLARKAGLQAQNAPVQKLASEMMDLVEQLGAGTVCVSVLPPLTISHARYLCKRLRQRFPELQIIVGLWGAPEPLAKARERLISAGTNIVVTRLSQVLAQVH